MFSGIPLAALVTKMLATACVVMAVSWSVGAFGPIIGGALAGLPMILGPGFYFLSAQSSAAFVAQAASYALLSMSATQFFLLAYIAMAAKQAPPEGATLPWSGPATKHHSPWLCLASAASAWLLTALVLRLLPAQPLVGVVIFIATTFLCWHAGKHFLLPTQPIKRKAGLALLVARGMLAGTLVAVVTSASQWLGPTEAGLLLAFPIGFTVVAVTAHQKYGRETVIATLYSALLGTASLATFCATLAVTSPHWSAGMALITAIAASVSMTLLLLFRGRILAKLRQQRH